MFPAYVFLILDLHNVAKRMIAVLSTNFLLIC